ncbi:hypothetical protein AY599_03745 [Leptolyngbya valderiana BDU 20041]|nr:hypothetical protein AY599_03745 [Leptolyngbya valderiana BDU 20041]
MRATATREPLKQYDAVPTTPGRIALLFACAGLMTFGLLSPVALLVSIIALAKKPDWFGFFAFVLSGLAVAVLVDVIFFGGVLLLLLMSVFG